MIRLYVFLLVKILFIVKCSYGIEGPRTSNGVERQVFMTELHNAYLFTLHYDKVLISRKFFKGNSFFALKVEQMSRGPLTHKLTITETPLQSRKPITWTYRIQAKDPYNMPTLDTFVKSLVLVQKTVLPKSGYASQTTKFDFAKMFGGSIDMNYEEMLMKDGLIQDMINKNL